MIEAKRLLIVDDEETIRFSLSQAFITAKEDYSVTVASSGEEALSKINGEQFDLIITDIMMPGMNGFELIEEIRKNKLNTPIIVITAYGDEEKEKKSYSLGVVEYIEKPFDIKEIREKVFNILKND